MTRVGFVGAGQLGLPMVRRLHAAGHDVVVFARRAEARQELEAIGVRAVATAAAAAEGAGVFLACLFSDEQLTEVAPAAISVLPRGAVFASHVTGALGTVQRLAEFGSSTGVTVHDAPVSGTADSIAAGRLTVLLGGDESGVARCSEVVAAYADPIVRTGPLGSALAVKLVNNLLLSANIQLVAEAVQVGERLGIAPAALLAGLAECSGASRALQLAASASDLGQLATNVAPFLSKDVSVAESTARELGIDLGLLSEVVQRGLLPLTNERRDR